MLPLLHAVVEVYAQWAGPTQACASTWRAMALEHGGALPFDLSAACKDKCVGVGEGSPLAGVPPGCKPHFLLFKGGQRVAMVAGLDMPTLKLAIQRHSVSEVPAPASAPAATVPTAPDAPAEAPARAETTDAADDDPAEEEQPQGASGSEAEKTEEAAD